MSFAPSQISVVLGPNGAGKSTLMSILATLSRPTDGTADWGDARLVPGAPARQRIGYVGHDPGLYGDLTAHENLRFFANLFGLKEEARPEYLDDHLRAVGLKHVLTDRRDAPVKTFSRGMQQRLALARALLHKPELLLFDEPASALDPAGARWLAEQLEGQRRAGRVVVMITHDLDAAAPVTDHVVILRRGRVAFDTVFTKPPTASELRGLYMEHTQERRAQRTRKTRQENENAHG